MMNATIKNEMETAVRKEVSLRKQRDAGPQWMSRLSLDRLVLHLPWLLGSGKKEGISCRCPLCRTDVIALALTALPPCYCRSLHYGISLQRVDGNQIRKEVQSAARKIDLRPRHPSRGPVPDSSGIRLIDFGLKEGVRMIGPLLERVPGACSCETCREDTLAFGLNRSEPRYGVEIVGKLRMLPHQLDFLRHELLGTFTEAARKIALNPRHGGKDSV